MRITRSARTACALGVIVFGGAAWAQQHPQLDESRALVDTFAARLQAALADAMTTDGPVAAVAVCKDLAPAIASELARTSGAKIGRTTLRPRNPLNAPDPWQTDVLLDFERRAQAAAGPGPLEHVETPADGSLRYMRAIRIGPACLVCHGETLAGPVAEVIDRNYPFDRARGYGLGDLRGAFAVTWPATTGPQAPQPSAAETTTP